ncbi:immunoglobulin A1 protease-like isoform X2 [Coccinella septempunctata]|uniref:immunoglobulin A1 protease-like isoform X2 n=1 Tax=Coccinella septempunctata TaxID=41139 RepID=UPI001D097171|nr:immunoglobulin A1 protease-like isoform X2 [Coccinella septempunctata]
MAVYRSLFAVNRLDTEMNERAASLSCLRSALLAHNEHNDNNIAFSPYGIGVILMALGEGLQGEALYEIRKALYLPYDAHTIRVGLRDIHRHLKSYFIPKEGFLAGITLNIENISINPEYIQLLNFYGYDINSFNTALYPENHVTTTESGVMGGREETTLTTENAFISSTLNPETTTMGKEDRTTTTDVSVVASTTIESVPPTSTKEPDQSTENQGSTSESPSDTTMQTSITNFPSTATPTRMTTTETVGEFTTEGNSDATETTTLDAMARESTTNFETTVSATSEVVYTTSDSTTVATEVTTEEGLDGDVTLSVTDTQSSVTEVSSSSEAELFTSVTTSASSTTDKQMETSTISTENTETTTSKIRSIRSSEEYFTEADNTLVIEEKVEEEISELESQSSDNKSDEEIKKKTKKFGAEDWSIRINNKIILLSPNEDPPLAENTVETIINKERRHPRSIEEYVITRLYHHHDFRPTKPYEPDQPLYFFLDEGTKEAGLDFMTYDTVLPFLYIPNPSAMALAFPLDNDRYYLLLLMPSETYRLDDLICKLYMHNTFKYILNNLELTHVRVNIPSFSLNGRITLTNTLQKLGIKRIFEPRQADFSPMTSTRDVYVTNIEQAVSVTIKNNLNIKKDTRHGHRYYSEPLQFDVNRPFLYFVIDSELQIILMTGKVLNPLNVRIK